MTVAEDESCDFRPGDEPWACLEFGFGLELVPRLSISPSEDMAAREDARPERGVDAVSAVVAAVTNSATLRLVPRVAAALVVEDPSLKLDEEKDGERRRMDLRRVRRLSSIFHAN